MSAITNYRFPDQTPEEILVDVPDVDDTNSRLRRQNVMNDLRGRAGVWLATIDKQGRGPSRAKTEKLAEDLGTILSQTPQ